MGATLTGQCLSGTSSPGAMAVQSRPMKLIRNSLDRVSFGRLTQWDVVDLATDEEGQDMGRHRRSAAGRAATGRATGGHSDTRLLRERLRPTGLVRPRPAGIATHPGQEDRRPLRAERRLPLRLGGYALTGARATRPPAVPGRGSHRRRKRTVTPVDRSARGLRGGRPGHGRGGHGVVPGRDNYGSAAAAPPATRCRPRARPTNGGLRAGRHLRQRRAGREAARRRAATPAATPLRAVLDLPRRPRRPRPRREPDRDADRRSRRPRRRKAAEDDARPRRRRSRASAAGSSAPVTVSAEAAGRGRGAQARQRGAGQGRLQPGVREQRAGRPGAGLQRGHGRAGLLRPHRPETALPVGPGGEGRHHRPRRREHSPRPGRRGSGDGGLDEQPRPPGQHPELRLQDPGRRRALRLRRPLVDAGLRLLATALPAGWPASGAAHRR